MSKVIIVVHFKHTLGDKLRNLFRPKAKRFPEVATFTGFDEHIMTGLGGLKVRWGDSVYHYPSHQLRRVKVTGEE
ncbi:hypothetical protein [Escherichia phage vB_EcoP_LHP]